MKKLTNKKGFTLIEMLVVIAIIAILVAIIIPTVTSATTKANAATDAANLRSAKAAITIGVLDGSITKDNKNTTCTADKFGIPEKSKTDGTSTFTVDIAEENGKTGKTVTVKYGEFTIADFAAVADKGGTLTHITKDAGGDTQG